jgi:hypothetical protein
VSSAESRKAITAARKFRSSKIRYKPKAQFRNPNIECGPADRSTKSETNSNGPERKHEIRISKSETNPNVQISNYQNKGGSDLSLGFSSFSEFLGFVCFEFRASDFGFDLLWCPFDWAQGMLGGGNIRIRESSVGGRR